MGRGRWLLLAATVAALVLVPSGASGEPVPAVSGKAVTTYHGWLQVSSLTGRNKWPLTPPHRYKRRRDYNPVWSPDGSQVAFARWTPKEVSVMVVNADGSGLRRVAVLGRHTKMSGDDVVIGWDDLQFMLRPHSDDVVFTHGRSIYEASLATKRMRTIRTLPCPKRRCPPLDEDVSLAGMTPDGRFALIEYWVFLESDPYAFVRDYRLDLATGAVTKTHLITADPAEIFLH
jgi:hypothetical protein